jgi:hypothetical protein
VRATAVAEAKRRRTDLLVHAAELQGRVKVSTGLCGRFGEVRAAHVGVLVRLKVVVIELGVRRSLVLRWKMGTARGQLLL